jgi:hypothetical protein
MKEGAFWMIKKNTKVVFEGLADAPSQDLVGGMPLSEGETVRLHRDGRIVELIVKEKTVDCFLDGPDARVDITYVLSKKK